MTPPRTATSRPVDEAARKHPVILLGDALRPAEDSFRPLRRLLGGQVRLLVKDLECVQHEPGADYRLATEVDALLATADEYGWQRFQLVASGEGASVALLAALQHPQRVLSLGLDEPVWAGNREPSGEEQAFWQRVIDAVRLEDTPAVARYCAIQLRKQAHPAQDEADLQPEPDTTPPDVPLWFERRRAEALRALWRAFAAEDIDYAALMRLETECYVSVGGDDDPAYEALAHRLHGIVRDEHVEVYEGRWRLDPPHDAEEERFALALAQLWRKSMKSPVAAGVGAAPAAGPHYG